MGSTSFTLVIEASSAREAFEILHGDAVYDKGHDHYNGTISTCSMGRCRKSYNTYSKANEKEALQIIRDEDNGEKWVARYIDLGVIHYEEISVKKVNRQYTAKYKQRFAVYDNDTGKIINSKSHFATKPEADKVAIEEALKGKDVSVKKTMVKLEGFDTVSDFEVTRKVVKNNKKASENKKVVPIHKYIFYGWGAS